MWRKSTKVGTSVTYGGIDRAGGGKGIDFCSINITIWNVDCTKDKCIILVNLVAAPLC